MASRKDNRSITKLKQKCKNRSKYNFRNRFLLRKAKLLFDNSILIMYSLQKSSWNLDFLLSFLFFIYVLFFFIFRFLFLAFDDNWIFDPSQLFVKFSESNIIVISEI